MVRESGPVVFKSGGGCLILFGLPFAVAGGAFFIASVMGKVEGMPWWGGVLFSLPFMLIGFGVMTFRSAKEFDPRRRKWRVWWGFVFPWRVREGDFDDVERIEMTREKRTKSSGSGSNRTTRTVIVFPVRVHLKGGEPIDVKEPEDFLEARGLAERISKAAEKPLHDRSGEQLVVTQPDELDMSIREKVRRRGEPLEIPPEPAQKRSKYEIDGTTVRFVLPPPGMGQAVVGILVATAPAVFVYFIFFRHFLGEEGMPGAVRYIFMAFLGLFIIIPALAGFSIVTKALGSGAEVEASPDYVRLRRKGLLGWRTTELSADDIEEVAVRGLSTGGREIVVVSDEKVISFGRMLEDGEKRWVAKVIEIILAS